MTPKTHKVIQISGEGFDMSKVALIKKAQLSVILSGLGKATASG